MAALLTRRIVVSMGGVRWQTVRLLVVDGLLALLVGAVVVGGTFGAAMGEAPPAPRPLDPLAFVLLGVAAIPLAVRRVWPAVTLVLTVAAVATYFALGYTYGPIWLAPSIGVYSVATRWSVRRSLLACGLALAAVYVTLLLRASLWQEPVEGLSFVVLIPAGFLLLPWAVGTVVRLGREDAVRTREEEARRRAYEERLRVAREVHDVVGHGLAAINMQAGVALHVLDKRPGQARPALEAIKDSSKEALDELRGTLAVFRHPDGRDGAEGAGDAEDIRGITGGSEPRSPSPGLAQLETLVTAMSDGGMPVDLVVTGDLRSGLSSAVDLAAYRIVQESLTNAARHAGPATATIRIDYEPDVVSLEITDDGRGAAGDSMGPGGHGITGMRERAAAVGGTLEAGSRDEGGFRVRARLPQKAPGAQRERRP